MIFKIDSNLQEIEINPDYDENIINSPDNWDKKYTGHIVLESDYDSFAYNYKDYNLHVQMVYKLICRIRECFIGRYGGMPGYIIDAVNSFVVRSISKSDVLNEKKVIVLSIEYYDNKLFLHCFEIKKTVTSKT